MRTTTAVTTTPTRLPVTPGEGDGDGDGGEHGDTATGRHLVTAPADRCTSKTDRPGDR